MHLEKVNNYMIKANSAFIHNNPNLKCYPIFVNKDTMHNNTSPLIISNNSDNKVCIPKDITIGTPEEMSNYHYSINEITLAAKSYDIKTMPSLSQLQIMYKRHANISTSLDYPKVSSHKSDNTLPLSPLTNSNTMKR